MKQRQKVTHDRVCPSARSIIENTELLNLYSIFKISTSKTKAIGVCGKNIQRVKIEIEGKIIEQVSNFNYLGSVISNEEKDINAKLQR
jgi:hypothetical protein